MNNNRTVRQRLTVNQNGYRRMKDLPKSSYLDLVLGTTANGIGAARKLRAGAAENGVAISHLNARAKHSLAKEKGKQM